MSRAARAEIGNDEARIERLARGDEPASEAVIDGKIGRVVDLPVLRPEHELAAKFVGKLIGIGVVYAIAGLIWSWRGAAWAARRVR